jgi:hypothetical protein
MAGIVMETVLAHAWLVPSRAGRYLGLVHYQNSDSVRGYCRTAAVVAGLVIFGTATICTAAVIRFWAGFGMPVSS